MIIKTVAIGNDKEAYIEERISDGVNIILSDDNNKGKTILIQSMLYAIGNKPIFPASFDYKSYYYYLRFEHNNIEYEVVRKGEAFIIYTKDSLHILDGATELKRYWTKEVFQLPEFQFKGKRHLADMELFVQLFFVGQDGKNTSSIFNAGYYHKEDFKNMLLSYSEEPTDTISLDDVSAATRKLQSLRKLRKDKLELFDFYKSYSLSSGYVSRIKDIDDFNRKILEIENIVNRITEVRKKRDRAASKKALWNSTLKELNSLNRNIEVGELRCMDCDSTNITFRGQGKFSYSFNVSTPEMRKRIIKTIEQKIENFGEDIRKCGVEIENWQNELLSSMEDEEISVENVVALKSRFQGLEEFEKDIKDIDEQIETLENEIQLKNKVSERAKEKRQEFLGVIINNMNDVKREIEGKTFKEYEDIFTKRGSVVSGSEETVFYISKLLSIICNSNHGCPIIMDSFRAEDLSTDKENRALKLFIDLSHQCILTTTIKSEEKGKYDGLNGVNIIDYSDHQSNKLLTPDYNKEFMRLLDKLSISLR
ncbi:hypothetical protein [Abiotrophia defectiva]